MTTKVTFDGVSKLIIVDNGITELDVQIDLYSAWKEWIQQGDNSKYLPAMRTIAGDPTKAPKKVVPHYFLTNGWKIRPYEGNHALDISGNLWADEAEMYGSNLTVPTQGYYRVEVKLTVTSDATAIGLGEIQAKTNNLPNDPASESTIAARPTLNQIEGSTVIAKEATIASKPSLADIEGSTILGKEATIASKPSLSDIEGSSVIAKSSDVSAVYARVDSLPDDPASEATVAARPTLNQIEESAVLAKEDTTQRSLGLSFENYCVDQRVYVNNKLVSCRMRIYNNASNVGTDNGVIGTYIMTATYSGGLLDKVTSVKI